MLGKIIAYRFLFVLVFGMLASAVVAQTKAETNGKKIEKVVDASCGQCQFGLKGSGCDLAVRYNGKAYFVDGTKINDHGDAHAKDGFCNAVRKAKVKGVVVNERFQAESFVLLPAGKKK